MRRVNWDMGSTVPRSNEKEEDTIPGLMKLPAPACVCGAVTTNDHDNEGRAESESNLQLTELPDIHLDLSQEDRATRTETVLSAIGEEILSPQRVVATAPVVGPLVLGPTELGLGASKVN